jgi:ATP synthase F1 complex assembly factor 2
LDAWRLAAVEQLTAASKSLVVAAAAACGRLTADQVQAAARLEEDAQMEEWGCVEAGHDLDMADMASRVGAPVVLLRLLQRQGGSAPSLDRAPQAQ